MAMLHLVRHGQASFGSRDYDQLSPLGRTQSQLLGGWLARTGAVMGHDGGGHGGVISGGMKRHRQTADACLLAWNAALAVPAAVPAIDEDADFGEFDHQEVLIRAHPEFAETGRLERFIGEQSDGRRAFQAKFGESVARWISGRHDDDYRESWSQFRARCANALQRAADAAAAQSISDVWVFTSGGPIAAITQHVLEIPDARVMDLNWAVLNASVSQFAHGRAGLRLHQFNSVAHLSIAGDPGLISYR